MVNRIYKIKFAILNRPKYNNLKITYTNFTSFENNVSICFV